jgi:hypothetical protein
MRAVLRAVVPALFVLSCGKSDPPPPTAAPAEATVDTRLVTQKIAPALVLASASASASASGSASTAPAAREPKEDLPGAWKFSTLDLSDARTKALWDSLAGVAQTQVLGEANKVTLVITPKELISVLPGEEESRLAYTLEPSDAGAGELVIKTKDGRKAVRFVDDARTKLRVAELDKQGAPVAIFVRQALKK